jgi:hypothetical protein
MTTANIFDLSASMQAEGFEYATMFKGSTPFGPFQVRRTSKKPEGSLFFSKLREFYINEYDKSWINEDTELWKNGEEEPLVVAPDWYNLVTADGHDVPDYSSRNVMFAKFPNKELVEHTDPRFKENGPFRLDLRRRSVPHWERLTNSFSGIHVDPCLDSNSEVFGNWDLDTVAIWNAYAFTDVRVFRNSGTPWTYEV